MDPGAVPEVVNLCKFTVKSLEVLFEWEIFPLKPSFGASMEKMQTNTLQPPQKTAKTLGNNLFCSQTTAETPLRCSSLINLISVVLLV